MAIETLRTISGLAIGYQKEDCINRRERRIFDKTDRDGNGILSEDEVIERRKKEANTRMIINFTGLIAGTALIAFAFKGKQLHLNRLVLGSGVCLGTSFSELLLEDEIKKTEDYEKEKEKQKQKLDTEA